MRTLPPIAPSTILSFDFDGTLHNPASSPPVPTEFFELVQALRESHGAVWGINTGRSMSQMVEGFIESRFPFLPDYVVAREREIYFPNAFGRWLPHEKWNHTSAKEIDRLFKRAKKRLKEIRTLVKDHTGAQWIEMEGERAGLIAQSDEEMEWIVAQITPMVSGEPTLGWQRNSIYLRFGHRDFQKGSSLAEIAKLNSLGANRCFAIGDSHNDIEMLDPSFAGMRACPSNAVEEIRNKIISTGGYLCSAAHGEAAIEALRHFFPITEKEPKG